MIIVTGTKRSGTSMWMQILKAAGCAIIGEPFPRDWASTIRAGNLCGFYESPLRKGIYFATNPDPSTGEYLCPVATQRVGVKIFVPGLLRTDPRFIYKVLATLRPWREYVSSVERLYQMERRNRDALRGLGASAVAEPRMMRPALAWWHQNYGLLRDAVLRRYPFHLVSYAQVLADPMKRVEAALRFVGFGDAARASKQVQAALRTQAAESPGLSSLGLRLGPLGNHIERDVEAVFDELYTRVHESIRFEQAFFSRLESTHARLLPLIRAEQTRVQALRRAARLSRRGESNGDSLAAGE